MRPLFTIHAGEYVVGDFIEKIFPGLDIWVPVKDSGIDLLVTGQTAGASVSLQVKLSRDYKPLEAATQFEKNIRAAGWLTIDHDKLANSGPVGCTRYILANRARAACLSSWKARGRFACVHL